MGFDGIIRASDVLIGAKLALVCGYGDAVKGCAFPLHGTGARAFLPETDSVCALQECMVRSRVITLERVMHEVDISTPATGTFQILPLEHITTNKYNAFVGNIGHFDNVVDVAPWGKMPRSVAGYSKPHAEQVIATDNLPGMGMNLCLVSDDDELHSRRAFQMDTHSPLMNDPNRSLDPNSS